MLVLYLEHAEKRGATILAEIVGFIILVMLIIWPPHPEGAGAITSDENGTWGSWNFTLQDIKLVWMLSFILLERQLSLSVKVVRVASATDVAENETINYEVDQRSASLELQRMSWNLKVVGNNPKSYWGCLF